jgi:acyl carrier protein
MTKAEFIKALAEVLETAPDKLSSTTELAGFQCWDSTAVINLLVVFDEHGIKVEEDKIKDCKTVQDLVDLTGGKLE